MRVVALLMVLIFGGCTYDTPSGLSCSQSDVRDGYACINGYWIVMTAAMDTSLPDLQADIGAGVEDADLDASDADLDASDADLDASDADLDASDADLDAQDADLDASDADLDASDADLDTSDADLGASDADLDASDADLDASDADLDAEPDVVEDTCVGGCFIDGDCVDAGMVNPLNSCQICRPGVEQRAWSNRVNNRICGSSGNCMCNSGSCEDANGMICS